jgi:hypothetical protein
MWSLAERTLRSWVRILPSTMTFVHFASSQIVTSSSSLRILPWASPCMHVKHSLKVLEKILRSRMSVYLNTCLICHSVKTFTLLYTMAFKPFSVWFWLCTCAKDNGPCLHFKNVQRRQMSTHSTSELEVVEWSFSCCNRFSTPESTG